MPANELIKDLFGVWEDDVARTLEEAVGAMVAEMHEEEDESAEPEADNGSTYSSDGAPRAPLADSAAASAAAPADAAEDRFAHLPIRELASWRCVLRAGGGVGVIHQISLT
jgi:hypothetical protein